MFVTKSTIINLCSNGFRIIQLVGICGIVVWISACNPKQVDNALDKKGGIENSASTSETDITPVPAQSKPKTKTQQWKKIATFKGEKKTTTKTFKVNSKIWQVKWSSKPKKHQQDEEIIIYMHNAKAKNDDENIANTLGAKTDSTMFELGAGEYYFDVSTKMPYIIEVFELK